MKHFTLIAHETNPKNKLQEEVQAIFKSHRNRIVNDDERAALIADIKNAVQQANKRFPNCTPVDFIEFKMSNEYIAVFAYAEEKPTLSFIRLDIHQSMN